MQHVRVWAVSVLLASSLATGFSCKSQDAGSGGSSSPPIGGGGGGGGGTTCSGSGTTPASLAAAYAALPESRPCWEWLDAQAASIPRKKPSFWKTIYFDTFRFQEEGRPPSDHTVETGQYQDDLLQQYDWISLAPAPPIAPPWAHTTWPHDEIEWPFSGGYEEVGELDEKLRGIATSILLARSKGVATRVSIMLPTGWNAGITITNEQGFRDFVDDTVVPQLTAFAKMAERTNSEYMGILSIEAQGLVEAFHALDTLTDDKKFELVQYYLTEAAQAISENFTGTSVSAGMVNYASSAIDWSQLDLSGFDEIGLTMSVPCSGDLSPTASITTQLNRVQAILVQNPGKPWSVGELQPPYANCGSARPASFAAFRTALDDFPTQPVGLGMDIAPINTPAVNIDATSLSAMSSWLSAKTTAGKVLVVIANQDFFFQEYADPKTALESQGFTVEVASGLGTPSTPHAGTGQSSEPGTVTPNFSISAVDHSAYQGLVIAGGYGASQYYFGYKSDHASNTITAQSYYDPSPAAGATALNALIGDFLAAGKPILGVCNGVNVLSWARVNGVSPLSGKTVSAPYTSVPAQTYRGTSYTSDSLECLIAGSCLPMKTFAEHNGATVPPRNSVGNPSTSSDDVSVDGLILTAQDNLSAAEGGQKLAEKILTWVRE